MSDSFVFRRLEHTQETRNDGNLDNTDNVTTVLSDDGVDTGSSECVVNV
jgi:hypothetical protein